MAVMAQGGKPDWSSLADHHDNPAPVLRKAGDDIVAAFDAGTEAPEGMIASELAVHTWDLATALGRDTGELDPAVAEAGYAFMSESLTDDKRGDSFEPEQQAPEGANAYERLAAFAGGQFRTEPSEVGHLGAGKRDVLRAIAKVDLNRGRALDADDAAEAVSVV